MGVLQVEVACAPTGRPSRGCQAREHLPGIKGGGGGVRAHHQGALWRQAAVAVTALQQRGAVLREPALLRLVGSTQALPAKMPQALSLPCSARRARGKSHPVQPASRMRRSLSARRSSCCGPSGRRWRRCRRACRSSQRLLPQRRLAWSASPAVTRLHVRRPAYAHARPGVSCLCGCREVHASFPAAPHVPCTQKNNMVPVHKQGVHVCFCSLARV